LAEDRKAQFDAFGSESSSWIPLMRPLLPDAAAVLPYLREIDRNRTYTNFGPLLHRFEQRVATMLGLEPHAVVGVASGTSGLMVALKAVGVKPGALCAMPAWTFEATPVAALSVGLTPWFLDVGAETWALDPVTVEEQLSSAPGSVAAVVPVSPFGATVDVAAWDVFTSRTGVPVVVDGAASFDGAAIGRSPTVISLHATKAFGIGEGGLVAGTDLGVVTRARRLSNFGFVPQRELVAAGLNAKMSEYAAAVGLAMTDAWPTMRNRYVERIEWYLDAFADSPEIAIAPGVKTGQARSTFNICLAAPEAEAVVSELARVGVESRSWWGQGCHRQSVFSTCPRGALPVTERLAARVIGLPLFPDMTEAETRKVRDAVLSVCQGMAAA
jgi:dTDP-4-amino-4,6-dideoxygalactose transaminase